MLYLRLRWASSYMAYCLDVYSNCILSFFWKQLVNHLLATCCDSGDLGSFLPWI